MSSKRSKASISIELPRLITRDSALSLRKIAERVNVSPAHLSRGLRGASDKTITPELAGKIALALGLPVDYFPEYREGVVIEAVKADAALRDRIYARLR